MFIIILLRKRLNKIHNFLSSLDISPYQVAIEKLKIDYISHKKLLLWRDANVFLYNTLKNENILGKYSHFKDQYSNKISVLDEFIWFMTENKRVSQYNESLVDSWKVTYKTMFDNIEKYPLDYQQIEAILHDEDYNLVVAWAGTGKTSTIVWKTAHLIKNKEVDPAKILLISFTNKAVNEMKERLNSKDIELNTIKTFHRLWYEILSEVWNLKKDVLDPEKWERLTILQTIFDKLLNDENFSSILFEYFTFYLDYFEPIESFDSEDAYHAHFQKEGKLISLDGKVVKSPDELKIANFLYLHWIPYEYERSYAYNTADQKYSQYKPDFYIKDNDVYLEHFSLYEDGVTSYFWPEYVQSVQWKRQLHQKNSTNLIETYSWEFKKKNVIDILKSKLAQMWVKVRDLSQEEMMERLNTPAKKQEYSLFVRLISTAISLFKSNQYTKEWLSKKAKEIRDVKFLEILDIMYKKYEEELVSINKIDFDDMIWTATEFVANNAFTHDYEYILVDEFQDISVWRYKLLQALLRQKQDCKLFCVWDDWQSIYRFTWSDVHIFTEFQEHFWFSKITTINNCYRFPQTILDVSSDFVIKNSSQLSKKLIAHNEADSLIEIKFLDTNSLFTKNSIYAIRWEIEMTSKNNPDKNIFVLCRYNFDIMNLMKTFDNQTAKKDNSPVSESIVKDSDSVNYNYAVDLIDTEQKDESYQFGENVRTLSVHKSKWLEADIVYLFIYNRGVYWFPCKITDDPVLEMFLPEKEALLFAEERRLFYVALTRTKGKLYIITNKQPISEFVNELITTYWNKILLSEIKTEFYAYYLDDTNKWIVHDWETCKTKVEWIAWVKYKSFDTWEDAKVWLQDVSVWKENINKVYSKTNKKTIYYAYYIDNSNQWVVESWSECEKITKWIAGAKYKWFESKDAAENWLKNWANYEAKLTASIPWIYFDAGTWRWNWTEASVTDENGSDLLDVVLAESELNTHKKLELSWETNNLWELTACKLALQIALKKWIKRVFGDSKLVIDYRSKWSCNLKDTKVLNLANEVAILRQKFEDDWWIIEYISWGSNPADLGFHK